MNCPHCDFKFRLLAVSGAEEIPPLAPIICEGCGRISLLVEGEIRKATEEELSLIRESPAWRDVLEPIGRLIRDHSKAPPVDRSKTMLTTGEPVTPDHRQIRADGMQKGYVVLNDEERLRGFVRPYRDTYTHKTCGVDTVMARTLAETYARDPKFYGGTFCAHCHIHLPLDQFVWKGTDELVGS